MYFDNVQLYSLETCLRIFTKPNLPELRLLVVGLRGSDRTYDRQSNRAETGDWRRAVVAVCDQGPSVPWGSLLSGGCQCQVSSSDCVCTLYLMKSSDKIHCDSECCL